MGIENDRLVFDYLSRVGDLAEQRRLPAEERRELVTGLRDEIERRREVRGERVEGILDDLGSPAEVVDRAAPAAPTAPEKPAVPAQRAPKAPKPPEWWQADDTRDGSRGEVAGFVGGVEIPELLKPPPVEDDEDEDADEDGDPEDEAEPDGPRSRLRRRLPRGLGFGSPLLVIAAVLLLVGAALGNLIPLGLGWLLAYFSPARRAAVLTLPGLTAAGAAIWLWGRVENRWGSPVAPGGEAMGAAVAETWPWALKTAAIASALFLLWRARRV
ncbi:hypothetical protein [Streptomyces sp. NPDC090025]|uniref:hypothetical protein n=1 Tax=Streptomyces sp. NPDC090025 TaxID=3365922 RepID=UPI003838C55A